MTWVVASFISVTEILEGNQSEYPIDEEFYLFKINSDDELKIKIKDQIELLNQAGAEGVQYYGKTARQYCLGVRKVKTIWNTQNHLDMDQDPPSDGSEVGYSYMTVKTLDEAKMLAEGKAVMVHYIDDDPLDE